MTVIWQWILRYDIQNKEQKKTNNLDLIKQYCIKDHSWKSENTTHSMRENICELHIW